MAQSPTARALFFTGPRRVEWRALDLRQPEDGEVLVRTSHSGISAGSEMLAYRGEVDPDLPLDETIQALPGGFAYPFRYGYSSVGRVELSRAPLHEGEVVFAFHPHQDLFVVAAADVLPVQVEPRLATLLPLVETALQVTLDAGQVLEETVVVLGLGPVGLLTAILLARAGAEVLGVDLRVDRRRALADAGLESVGPSELRATVRELSGGRGVPLVVEASGSPEALGGALDLLAHEGAALVVSWYGTKPVSLPLGGAFHRRRLSIRSTQVSTIPASLSDRWDRQRRRRAAGRLLGELPLASLATHTFPAPRAAEAFEAVDRGDEGLMHAALCYP
ncbi:MAG: zinc-binding alcohol dehydrogenase [Actinomycetota bacterium]|nr:zinc-binding alcohol dehydrogenase [Actinomycetota bacterium]